MRRSSILSILIAVLGIAPACDNTPSPSAPLRLTPVVPPPAASLVIEQTSLIVLPDPQGDAFGEPFLYEPRFQLRETNGKSGATIQGVFVDGDSTGPECWKTVLRVPPGGILDTFYSDEGWKWLGYCGPWGGGKSAAPTVHVSVTFTDDSGGVATVYADVSAGT